MVDTQHFCLRWNNYQSSITSAFENLRDDEDFVDVTLACDGKSLKAHRVVLSACSPYFRELLKSTPCKHPVIVLQDVAWTDLHALVEFIYHGEVNVHQRSLSSFLKTAEVLRVSGLTQQHGDDREQLAQVQSLVRSQHTSTPTALNHHSSFTEKLVEDALFTSPSSPPPPPPPQLPSTTHHSAAATVNQLLRRAAMSNRRERRISSDPDSEHKRARSEHNNNNNNNINNNLINNNNSNNSNNNNNNSNELNLTTHPPQTQPADFSPSAMKNNALNLNLNTTSGGSGGGNSGGNSSGGNGSGGGGNSGSGGGSGGGNNSGGSNGNLKIDTTEGNGISSTERENSPCSPSPPTLLNSRLTTDDLTTTTTSTTTTITTTSNVKSEPMELLCSTNQDDNNSNDSDDLSTTKDNNGPNHSLPQGPHSGGSSIGGSGGGIGDHDDHDSSPIGPYLTPTESKLFATAAGSFNFSMAALAADPTGLGGLNQSLQANADSLAGTSQGASPKKVFTCQLCGKVLCSKASLKRHIADKHAERQEEYRCVICERVYCSRNSLMTHIYTYHKSRPGDIDIKFF